MLTSRWIASFRLLEYTRTQLGQGMPIVRECCGVGEICDAALEEMKSSQPDRAFCLATSGALGGFFDRARLEQAFANLLNNAVQHGARDSPVVLEAHGTPEAISVHVRNDGTPIPADALQVIFDPLVRVPNASRADDARSISLGLGLFIARSIVQAHGGTLEVESSEASGTVFTARLPMCAVGRTGSAPAC